MRTTYGIRPMVAATLFTFIVLLGLLSPSQARAAEVRVQTAQLLPPGVNTCAPGVVSGFTPYVYDGSLHSFEFVVGDSSYVAIAASAGTVNIPFNQMSRQVSPQGVRIHADMETTSVRESLPITVTMLSAKGGSEPVCISVISTIVELTAEELTQLPPAPLSTLAPTPSTPTTVTPQPKPTTPSATKPSTSTIGGEKGPTTTATSAAFATTQNILKDICIGAGAARLWLILLALFAAIVAFAAFGQPQLPPSMRTQEWTAAAIVVPFLLLFGLWYFAESCRTSPWVPVIATIIALAGLSVAFWERSGTGPVSTQTIINLPGAKK
ncbi:hypothetical protein A2853_01175 [Candidatus Kaiserbacteria bacterium RIFCSPHIGHO2_01_FULL_55_17]|uniref:Uncharacterized protein n=1 Tax=Candidatus Kaiserbacteria bacterium RIFCSPHIGHO2_01_FULL_55_17 TaxID=1798484 RepID=A0A1F6D9I1_9BACT|nr:MAG: hypothetical protein A2853_01175 [Candidatus Kaiserbacteria bacterium RIFCSPHIGHO2_01_FULL_55_17]